MKKAIILLSGGMDSTVCTAIAHHEGYILYALHLNYGQRTEKRELKSFHDVCNYYGIPTKNQLIIDISHLSKIGGSALTDTSINLKKDGTLTADDEIPKSYVPFRNANILSIAVSWAEIIEADALFIGTVQEDSSGYPDCRKEFIKAFETAANLGTKPETTIHIKTPIIDLSKKEIVERGTALKAPLELSWSCYDQEDAPCQQCESCLLRARGFAASGITDPILQEPSELVE